MSHEGVLLVVINYSADLSNSEMTLQPHPGVGLWPDHQLHQCELAGSNHESTDVYTGVGCVCAGVGLAL